MEDPTIGQNLKEGFRKNKAIGSFDIANHFTAKYHIITIGGKHDRELYIYKDGVYIENEKGLRREIQEILCELTTAHHKNEIIDKIKDATIAKRDDFTADKNFINLNNGIFNIATGVLAPHDPAFIFFYKFPADFNPEANCPGIKKFLEEILESTDLDIIQEWFGYALYRSYFIKKAIVFVGDPDTGKTTLLRVLERFIGKQNISGISLQKISSDKFSAAQFYNKHVNVYDDLSFRDINDNGAFKIATGGGSITGEYKYGDQFQFENHAKLTFACNKIPDVKDTNDPAYFNRWIILHFQKEITSPDKFLIEKIATPQELSGLLNFAIAGLDRLLKTQEFSYKKESHEIKTEMERSGSPIAQFAQDCLEEAPGEWVSKQEMFEAFMNYVRARHLPIATIDMVGKKIRNYAEYIIDSKKTVAEDKTRVLGWRNVKIKAGPELTDEIITEELF